MTTQMQMGTTERPAEAPSRQMQAEAPAARPTARGPQEERPQPQMGVVFDDWAAI